MIQSNCTHRHKKGIHKFVGKQSIQTIPQGLDQAQVKVRLWLNEGLGKYIVVRVAKKG